MIYLAINRLGVDRIEPFDSPLAAAEYLVKYNIKPNWIALKEIDITEELEMVEEYNDRR